MANLLWEIEGRLPDDKGAMLRVIGNYKSKSKIERLKFILERRLRSYASVYGGLNNGMEKTINAAFESLEQKSADAAAKVEAALAALKSGFV